MQQCIRCWLFRFMCNKISHKTTYGAAAHINALRKRKRYRGKMGVYYCNEHDAYHITRHPGKGSIIVL